MPCYPLLIEVRPSPTLRFALLTAHALAAWAVGLADLPRSAQAALGLALLVSAAWTLRPRPRLRLRLGTKGELKVAETTHFQPAQVQPGSIVTAHLCLLRYRIEGERRTRALPILRDSLAPEPLRALRLWLRWQARCDSSTHGEKGSVQSGA